MTAGLAIPFCKIKAGPEANSRAGVVFCYQRVTRGLR